MTRDRIGKEEADEREGSSDQRKHYLVSVVSCKHGQGTKLPFAAPSREDEDEGESHPPQE